MGAGRENQRTIFVIEEDDETRPLLKANLRAYGYRVLLALDEEDARERVRGGLRADLILVNLVGKTAAQAVEAGRAVRAHSRFDGRTPLVVMAEHYGPDLEGTSVNVGGNDWIIYPEDHHQLKNLLARLLDDPPN
jgi:DNA-binding NtrC family response regulator